MGTIRNRARAIVEAARGGAPGDGKPQDMLVTKPPFVSVAPPPNDPPARGSQALIEAYKTAPWLRAVVGQLAAAVGDARWRIYLPRKGGKGVDDAHFAMLPVGPRTDERRRRLAKGDLVLIDDLIEQHPAYTLLYGGSTLLSGSTLMSLTQVYLELVGEAFWALERNQLGAPIGAYPIPPHWVQERPTQEKPRYLVRNGQFEDEIAINDMIPFVDPDPANPYSRGAGVAASLVDEIDIDEYTAKTLAAYFFNRATPEMVITAEDATEEEGEVMRRRWFERLQGVAKRYLPYFVNRKLDVKVVSQPFRDMQLAELRKHQRDVIQQTYGIPPEIMGVIEQANRCVDASSTETLTYRGWATVHQLTDDDLIATWNPEAERVEYHRPNAILKYDYDGPMHHWRGDRVDAMVTPNHRMWVRAAADVPWGFCESQECSGDTRWANAVEVAAGVVDVVGDMSVPISMRTSVPYRGVVWCVDVPNHLFFTRRNGVVALHGNSTVTAAGYMFDRFKIVPRLERIRQTLQRKLMPQYDSRLVIDYDNPTDRDNDFFLRAAQVAPWAKSYNEWRVLMGEEPEEGMDDVHMLGSGQGLYRVAAGTLPTAVDTAGTPPVAGSPGSTPRPEAEPRKRKQKASADA